MIFGDLVCLKLPDICLTGEENPRRKTSPRKLVPTEYRNRDRCMTGAHATACSTEVGPIKLIVKYNVNYLISTITHNSNFRIKRQNRYSLQQSQECHSKHFNETSVYKFWHIQRLIFCIFLLCRFAKKYIGLLQSTCCRRRARYCVYLIYSEIVRLYQ